MARRGTDLILVADASILIDLDRVGGIEALPGLGQVEVLDVVLAEVDNPHQPLIAQRLRSVGAVIVPTERRWVAASLAYRNPGLSIPDALNVYYALTFGRVLLAGDRKLRNCADAVHVEVHGSLWLVEQLDRQGVVSAAELVRWLDLWPRLGRRLPPRETAQLRAALANR